MEQKCRLNQSLAKAETRKMMKVPVDISLIHTDHLGKLRKELRHYHSSVIIPAFTRRPTRGEAQADSPGLLYNDFKEMTVFQDTELGKDYTAAAILQRCNLHRSIPDWVRQQEPELKPGECTLLNEANLGHAPTRDLFNRPTHTLLPERSMSTKKNHSPSLRECLISLIGFEIFDASKPHLMAKAIKTIALLEEKIINKIYMVRDKKVILDYDLAEMYSVETKQLKRQVKRNIKRFPPDFMFILSSKEYTSLRSQFGTLNRGEHSKYAPMAFTEQGVSMLSSVLNSETAIKVNIQIIRIFTRMRELLLTHKDILLKLEQMEKQVTKNSEDIRIVFAALKKLLIQPPEPRPRIGFRRSGETN